MVKNKKPKLSNSMAEDKKSIPRRQSGKGVSKEESKENTKMIQTAHLQYKQQVEKERQKAQYADMSAIHAMLTEYLGPFILIGFDLQNESVELVNIKNALEKNAIESHLKKVFVERVIKGDD
jgi:hypothetical protein